MGKGRPYAGQLIVNALCKPPPISVGIPSRSILGGAKIKRSKLVMFLRERETIQKFTGPD